MASKYDKYFYYKSAEENPFHPPGSFAGTELFVMNDMVVKGAPLFGVVWFTGPWDEKEVYKPHTHSCDEVMAVIGSDPDHPEELNGEIEFWIEDEKFLITKTCMMYLPAGLQHAPMFPRRVDKPILWADACPIGVMNATYSKDPKWNRFKDPLPMPDMKRK
jgi:hypothetical protein